MRTRILFSLVLVWMPPAPAFAQGPHLSLVEALHKAEQAAYANRIAAGRVAAQSGQALAPFRGILPTVRLEGGYVRTTDPLNAFGFTLQQRTVTPGAFDPDRLNYPPATGNVTSGLVLELPLLNADAYYGRGAATRARDASQAAENWAHQTTALEVVRAYYGATLAKERIGTLETALAAARAHLRQAESLERNGLATRSDALLAEVKAGEIEAQLITARSQADIARRQLATLLGAPSDTTFRLADSLPSADRVRALQTLPDQDTTSVAGRADVRAAHLGLEAADRALSRARSLYLPRLNSFGRLDWNDPTAPFGGKNSWTVGVLLSWSPFAGASERAEIVSAGGRRAEAAAVAEAAEAQAALELAEATDGLTAALARLGIAERAVHQSQEAHRIVGRKYEGGLATVVELFDAGATETQSRLQLAAARYDAIVAAGARRVAGGLDLSVLSNLES